MADEAPRGHISMSRRALAAVVANAVLGCDGVVGFAPRPQFGKVDRILARHALEQGMEVRCHEGRLSVDLYVIMEHGTQIAAAGRQVASTVRETLERALGVPVARVTINVQALRVSRRG